MSMNLRGFLLDFAWGSIFTFYGTACKVISNLFSNKTKYQLQQATLSKVSLPRVADIQQLDKDRG